MTTALTASPQELLFVDRLAAGNYRSTLSAEPTLIDRIAAFFQSIIDAIFGVEDYKASDRLTHMIAADRPLLMETRTKKPELFSQIQTVMAASAKENPARFSAASHALNTLEKRSPSPALSSGRNSPVGGLPGYESLMTCLEITTTNSNQLRIAKHAQF